MKYLILVAVLFLSACDTSPTDIAVRTTCIDGVTYVYFQGSAGYNGFGYMSVKLNRDSKIVECL